MVCPAYYPESFSGHRPEFLTGSGNLADGFTAKFPQKNYSSHLTVSKIPDFFVIANPALLISELGPGSCGVRLVRESPTLREEASLSNFLSQKGDSFVGKSILRAMTCHSHFQSVRCLKTILLLRGLFLLFTLHYFIFCYNLIWVADYCFPPSDWL
jgi:hypothetical protein